jgi:hypothetical protein
MRPTPSATVERSGLSGHDADAVLLRQAQDVRAGLRVAARRCHRVVFRSKTCNAGHDPPMLLEYAQVPLKLGFRTHDVLLAPGAAVRLHCERTTTEGMKSRRDLVEQTVVKVGSHALKDGGGDSSQLQMARRP